jgi:hypothetical protein
LIKSEIKLGRNFIYKWLEEKHNMRFFFRLVPNVVFYIVKLINQFVIVDEMSIDEGTLRWRSPSTKVCFDEGPLWRRSASMKVRFDEGPLRWRFPSMKVPFDKGLLRWRSAWMKVRFDEGLLGWRSTLMKVRSTLSPNNNTMDLSTAD